MRVETPAFQHEDLCSGSLLQKTFHEEQRPKTRADDDNIESVGCSSHVVRAEIAALFERDESATHSMRQRKDAPAIAASYKRDSRLLSRSSER